MLRSLLIAHRNNGAAAVVGEPREARVVQVEVVQHPAAPVVPHESGGSRRRRWLVNAHWHVCCRRRKERRRHVQNGFGGAGERQAAARIGA